MATHIGQAAERSGLSIDTIRYYDRLGLLSSDERDRAGRRVFGTDAVRWLVFLRRMRATGMPLSRVREYVAHRERGSDGVPGVLAVLRAHRAAMHTARAELDDCLAVVETKIAKYEELARTAAAPGPPDV